MLDIKNFKPKTKDTAQCYKCKKQYNKAELVNQGRFNAKVYICLECNKSYTNYWRG